MWFEELQRESGSHLYASLAGFDTAASQADVAQIILASGYLNAHRDRKKHPDPISLPTPWPDHDSNADVTPERRAELEAQLNRRSAFPD